jgi:hypothetical protein
VRLLHTYRFDREMGNDADLLPSAMRESVDSRINYQISLTTQLGFSRHFDIIPTKKKEQQSEVGGERGVNFNPMT